MKGGGEHVSFGCEKETLVQAESFMEFTGLILDLSTPLLCDEDV